MNEKSTEQPVELIFVYGNARRGGSADHVLSGHTLWAGARSHGRLLHLYHSPVLIPGGNDLVMGELYEAVPEVLDAIHESEFSKIEDASHFRKVKIAVLPFKLGVKSVEAWTWEWSGPEERYTSIRGGDWKHRETPWFTLIAAALLASFPLGILLLMYVEDASTMTAFLWLACWTLSPLMAWASLVMAGRRHERQRRLREILRILALLASVPAVFALIQILRECIAFLRIP